MLATPPPPLTQQYPSRGSAFRPLRCVVDVKTESETALTAPPSAAIDDLYRAHAVALVRLALVLVGDQQAAEDVVQEAFIGLYKRREPLSDPDAAPGYLRASVINGCRNVLRARKRSWRRPVPHDPPVWSAEAAVIDGEVRREVLAAVARLPRRQREVLILRYYLDLNESEIAAALGVSRGTVSSTASRALAALDHALKGNQ